MRRALAAALALASSAALAEPYDIDLRKLGPPDVAVWNAIASGNSLTLDPAQAGGAAADARMRFGILSSEMALALTSASLSPGTTTGHSGFDVAVEISQRGVHPDPVGGNPIAPAASPWAIRSATPVHELSLASVHVRKALPFSFELGGRFIYPAQSSYFAGQLEVKWALNEGFRWVPDVAIRAAHTQLFGVQTWNLSATDVDITVSKAFGVNGVMSVTPYVVGRITFVHASSDAMVFTNAGTMYFPPPNDNPATPQREDLAQTAAFPGFDANFARTTLGLRVKTYAVSLAAEATYSFGGKKGGGAYPDFDVASAWGAAARLGFEF